MLVGALALVVSLAATPRGALRSKTPVPEVPLLPLGAVWTIPLGVAPAAPPAFDDTHLYLPLETGDLAALALLSGESRWQTRLPTKLAPAVSDGRVVVASETGLEAIRAANGTSLWRVPLDAPAQAPQLRSGWTFLVLKSNDLDAYAADTGRRVWRTALTGAPTTPLVIDGDHLYLGLEGQGVVAFDVMTGARRWQAPLDGDVTALNALGDRLFAGTKTRSLHSLDARTGRGRWRWRIGGEVCGLDVQAHEVVALMLDQSMRAFKAGNGAQTWREPLNFRPFAGPIRTGSDLVIAGYGPTIRTYATSDGKRRGNYTIPAAAGVQGEATFEALVAAPYIHDRPGFVEDLVILVTQRGTVHAAKRQLMPALTPLTVVPGVPLPLPAAPDRGDSSAPPAPPGPPG